MYTVPEIAIIGFQESPTLTYPTEFGIPVGCDPIRISLSSVIKLEFFGYIVRRCLRDPTFSHFTVGLRVVRDGQMDGYTTMTSHAKTMEIMKGRGGKKKGNDWYGFETGKDNKGSNRGSGINYGYGATKLSRNVGP